MTVPTNSDAPPAGWYPAPQQPGVLQWWDGSQWTAHTNPPTASAPQTQPRRNGVAGWGLALGIAALVMVFSSSALGSPWLAASLAFPLSVVSFVLSLIGLGRAKVVAHGRKAAIWGTSLASLAFALTIVLVVRQASLALLG